MSAWLTPELATMLGITVSAFICILALLNVVLGDNRVENRIKAVAGPRTPRRILSGSVRQQQQVPNLMKTVVDRLNLMRSNQANKIADRLAQAGWRRPDAVIFYLFAKVCAPFACAGIVALLVYGLGIFRLSTQMQLLVGIGSVLLGSYAPELFIRNSVTRRAHELRRNLPDALDLLVVCTEAGLALDAAIDRVSREIGASSGAMADELGHTVVELRFLPERRKALERLAKRAAEVPGVQALVNTLIQTEKFGTPLAQSLRVLAAEMRTQRLVKAEEKAARLPAIMTVPLIVFILPALFVVLIGPAILDLIDAFSKM